MKRERIKIEENDTSTKHSFRYGFFRWIPPEEMSVRREALAAMKRAKTQGIKLTFKDAMRQIDRRIARGKIEATAPADSYITRLMNEATAAQQLAKNAKAYETECWAKLSLYLLDGTRDDGKKPRIRIIENDADIPAQGQQGAR